MQITPRATSSKTYRRKGRARKGEGSIKLRGRIWWFNIPDPRNKGKRIEGSCETENYDEAVRCKNAALLRAGAVVRNHTVLISEILDIYFDYVKANCSSVKTVEGHVRDLKTSFGHLPVADFATDHAAQFRKDEIAKGNTHTTANRKLSVLRSAFIRGRKATPPKVLVVPWIEMTSEKANVRKGFVTRKEYPVILKHLDDQLKALFVCAFHVGARSGELKSLEWTEVNFDKGVIELAPEKVKNGEGRYIAIWGEMDHYLRRQKQIRDKHFPDCPWVFFWWQDDRGRVAGNQILDFYKAWESACKRAGFPNLLFHDLRRSAIKYADQVAQLPSVLVRQMSGHKTESVYRRYNITGANDAARTGELLNASLRPTLVKKRA